MSILVGRCASRYFKVCPIQRCVALLSTEEGSSNKAKKKKPPEIRINVIENSTLTVMSKESALKLGNRRNLHLIEVDNPAHWMLAGNRKAFEFRNQASKVTSKKEVDFKSQGFRGLKQAVFGANIQEHDIATRTKQITKWMKSGFVVEIAIDVSEKSEEIKARVESEVKDLAKLPGTVKRKSSTLHRIQYEPLLKSDSDEHLNETAEQI